MTLIEFLNARLDEDEAVVKEAIAALERDPDALIDDGLGWYANNADSSGDSIVAVGPRRAAAEVEAKRRIVKTHSVRYFGRDSAVCETCHTYTTDYGDEAEDFPCITLRLLASVYADHPDYRQEWKP